MYQVGISPLFADRQSKMKAKTKPSISVRRETDKTICVASHAARAGTTLQPSRLHKYFSVKRALSETAIADPQ